MFTIHTVFRVVAAMTLGASLVTIEPARAELGAGGSAIGSGGERLGAALDSAPSGAPRAGAPRAVGQCVTNRTAYRTQINQVDTSSTAYSVMPNTHFPVTHQAGCLIVDFAGLVILDDAANRIVIRAWIGGIGAAEPFETLFGFPPEFEDTRSMRFVFPNVPAGTHTVRIDWRSGTGGPVSVAFRTLTVQYR